MVRLVETVFRSCWQATVDMLLLLNHGYHSASCSARSHISNENKWLSLRASYRRDSIYLAGARRRETRMINPRYVGSRLSGLQHSCDTNKQCIIPQIQS